MYFCMKFVWPPIIQAMREREAKIADGLNAATQAEQDLADAKAEVAKELAQAKEKAAEIIDQANKRAGKKEKSPQASNARQNNASQTS